MRTLVFDTETTGLPDFKDKDNLMAQPFIVQVAAVLFDERRPVGHFSAITIPEFRGERAPIPPEALAVHGITDDLVDRVALSPRNVIAVFNNLIKKADRLVAHNMSFDYLLMRAAYSRVSAPQKDLWEITKVCTMQSSVDVLKLPAKRGYKWPSLARAHKFFTGEDFEGAHDAMVDVLACSRVLWGLEDQGCVLKGD